MILAHRHRHARPDPRHRADRRDKPDADERGDDAATEITEDVLSGDQRDIELSGHRLDRRRVEKDGIEDDV